MPARLLVVLATIAGSLLVPQTAPAAQRWASPTSTVTSGACLATSPCRIDHAVNAAASGDEVIVAPGTYTVGSVLLPTVPITLRGEAGRPRPQLVGSTKLTSALLSFKAGGTLRHLALEATATDQDALTLEGGIAEDLVLRSAASDGAKVVGSPAGTVLRDTVVQTKNAAEGAAGLKLRDAGSGGDVLLRNVTVMAPNAPAVGIRCEVSSGQATLVNVIVRGGAGDIEANSRGAQCSATHSNFRSAASPSMPVGVGHQEAAPLFRDAAAGDYRPAAGSPTIDAGIADASLGATDLAGCARASGAGPDIGAYEYVDDSAACAVTLPPGDLAVPDTGEETGPSPEDVIRGVPAPVMGTTVVVAPGRGNVLVRRPGTRRFRKLDGATRVPVGSTFDAREGRVRLVSSVDADGTLQLGTFWGSRFRVRQSRDGNGMTSLVLRGGDFSVCRPALASGAVAVTSGKRRRAVRRLWGRDRNGRFRTHGNDSVATTRGTRWLTVDRCDGTLTRVESGAVAVRNRHTRKTVLVKAGRTYLARVAR
jgi:hypothetical protein